VLEDLAAGDRRPRRERDAGLGRGREHHGLVDEGMELDLVDHERRRHRRPRGKHHRRGVVRDADPAREPAVVRRLQELERRPYVAADRRPVQEQHVDVVGP
jgi:hypothetical protein